MRRATLRLLAIVAGLAVHASCALFYDFDDGEGGSAGTTGATGTRDASVSADSASASGSGSGGWCRPELCFGAACADENSCEERVFQLQATGRRIHIDADEPSVSVITFDGTAKAIGLGLATETTFAESPTQLTTNTAMGGLGFVSHDATSVAFVVPEAPERLVFVSRSSWAELAAYQLDQVFPSAGRVNGLERYPTGWLATFGSHLVTIDPTHQVEQFEDVDEVVAGSQGYGIQPIDKNRVAFSFFEDVQGCVGIATLSNGTGQWSPDCLGFPKRAYGVGVSDAEIYYLAQEGEGSQTRDVVGALGYEESSERIVVRMPATSAQVLAVDAHTLYVDGAKSQGRGLFACPKDGVEQVPENDCVALVEHPEANAIVGGMASGRIHPGLPDERWLVCWTIDDQLRCRVTPPAGIP